MSVGITKDYLRIKRLVFLICILAAALVLSSCAPEQSLSIEFRNATTSTQALSDSELISSIQSYLILAYDLDALPVDQDDCNALVNGDADLWLTNNALLAAQVLEPEEVPVYTFGILPEGFYSVMVLGTTAPYSDFSRNAQSTTTLRTAFGSIVATGCTEIDVEAGSRSDVKVILYPAGRL